MPINPRIFEQASLARLPPLGVTVDVGDQHALPPTILRGGNQVVPPVVNNEKVASFVNELVPIDRFFVPRVLSQSVPANTRVAVGTTIDLVLVPVNNIQLNLLGNTHADLSSNLVSDLLPVVAEPQVAAILQKTTDPTTLTDAEKAVISGQFTKMTQASGAPVQIIDNDPARNFAAAFATLQSVRSFE